MSHVRVLIGFAEALAAIEVAWSLLDAGFEVHAFSRDPARAPLRLCPSIRMHRVTAPDRDVDAAIRDVQRVIDDIAPAALMPLDDATVWLSERLDLPPSVALVGPAGPQAELALDKRLQTGAALQADLPVPETRICATVDDAMHPRPAFPVMVKPCFAIESNGSGLIVGTRAPCANEGELRRVAESYRGSPFFLQPYLPGVGEGLFGLARNGEVVGWSAHRRVRMMSPLGSGSSACEPAPVDERLAAAVAAMVRDMDWNGIFMIELLREPTGQVWFIELNGRAWGSMALARRMGFEYPAWAVRSRLEDGYSPALPAPREPVVCRHLGRELVHLLIVMRGSRSKALVEWPSRGRTLRQVLRVGRRDRWYNLRRGAFGLFLSDTFRTVGTQVKQALRS